MPITAQLPGSVRLPSGDAVVNGNLRVHVLHGTSTVAAILLRLRTTRNALRLLGGEHAELNFLEHP
ncbi:hypothetical protein [Embleya sp. NPDC005971]|uniref:hypothetical protein n=1 Tax=Embleya sp. NPDC005971 TaxID=3156724 RepID=UPI0033E766C4